MDLTVLVDLVFEYIDFYERPRPARSAVEALVRRLQTHTSEGIQFVADLDGRLVGFATLYFTYSTLLAARSAILNDLYVLPIYRQRGIGRTLFDACLDHVHMTSYAQMEWVTAPDNRVAQEFYERAGACAESWIVYSAR